MRSRIKKSAPASKSIETAPPEPPPPAEKRQSLIGASLRFEGEIRSAGSVRIEGQVKGTVAAHSLTVGQSGEVAGRAVAAIARIDGRVEGDLEADTVVLGPTARVVGDITHRSLAVEPGARFEGRSVHSRAEAVAEVDAGAGTGARTPAGAAGPKRSLRPH